MEVDCFPAQTAATARGQVQHTPAESLRLAGVCGPMQANCSSMWVGTGSYRTGWWVLARRNLEATVTQQGLSWGRAWLWHEGDHRPGQQGAAQEASLLGWLWGTMAKNGMCGGRGHGQLNIPLGTAPLQSRGFILFWPDCWASSKAVLFCWEPKELIWPG